VAAGWLTESAEEREESERNKQVMMRLADGALTRRALPRASAWFPEWAEAEEATAKSVGGSMTTRLKFGIRWPSRSA